MTEWYLYIIRCDDKYLYTGISTNVDRRVAEHRTGGPRAASYTRPFSSIALVYKVKMGDRKTAARVEYRIKKMPKRDKEAIVSHQFRTNELKTFVGLPVPDAEGWSNGD
jgi:putative endonuclease